MRRVLVTVGLLLLVGCSQAATSQDRSSTSHAGGSGTRVGAPPASPSPPALEGSCPVTAPNGSAPPGVTPPNRRSFGNGRLWTVLWPSGLVLVPPDDIAADGSLGMKFPWWRGPGVHGHVHIRGHELTLGIPLRADARGYGTTGFNASAVYFPVEGCYRITGEAGGATLTFVTMVRSCSALAELSPAQRKRYKICS